LKVLLKRKVTSFKYQLLKLVLKKKKMLPINETRGLKAVEQILKKDLYKRVSRSSV